MSAVLGVSVGTSAVRMTTPKVCQAVEVGSGRGAELAAQSIGVLLEHEDIGATGVAFGDDLQADAMHQAMALQRLHNYQLVPEAAAVVALLESVGQLGPDDHTLVLYDLGSSGVTVSVVDRYSRTAVAVRRSDVAGGDLFDGLIAEQQWHDRGIDPPADDWAAADFASRCRTAKEQLSTSGAAAVSGDGGLILLNRERFESLVRVPIEGSARLAREVVAESGRSPDLLVLLGGGARIPLVQSLVPHWLALPTVVPPEPEMVAAQGAALLATPVEAPAEPEPVRTTARSRGAHRPPRGPSRRQLGIAGAAAAGLVVIAGIGFALDRGDDTSSQGEQHVVDVTEAPAPPSTTTPAPTTTTPAPAPVAPVDESEPEPIYEESVAPAAPAPRYLNLPAPIQIEVPPNIQLPPGMTR
ncbi:Hsp70 family protein [Rhodococcus sp. NPDC003318]|uniref:Hsp70 family protein n=1 Tax=Rhodococcus sp. NPDC003318 TaxID=3364503 RepID=UPI00368A4409